MFEPDVKRVCLNNDEHSEIILATGAIWTPWLLFNSGVGPSKEVAQLEKKLLLDVPDLGKHIKDRPCVTASYFLTESEIATPQFGQSVSSVTISEDDVFDDFEPSNLPNNEECFFGKDNPKCGFGFFEEIKGGKITLGMAHAIRQFVQPEMRGDMSIDIWHTVRSSKFYLSYKIFLVDSGMF